MGAIRNHGPLADPEKVRAALHRSFGQRTSITRAAEWILENRWITDERGRRVNGVTLPSGKLAKLPAYNTIMDFLCGSHASRSREAICIALNIQMTEIEAMDPSGLDNTAQMIEVLSGNPDEYDLFKLLQSQSQPYTYATTSAFRGALRMAECPERILALGAKLLPDIWKSHPHVAGIISTGLSTSWHLLDIPDSLFTELQDLCAADLDDGCWPRVGSVEPLAFTLGAKGEVDAHRSYLAAVVGNEQWRNADGERVAGYYGSYGDQVVGIARHLEDPWREKGLLRANDAARLMHLISLPDPALRQPKTFERLKSLLTATMGVISGFGDPVLLRGIQSFIRAQGSARRTSSCT